MGKYDGVISDFKDYESQVKFNMNEFHFSNDNMININKNLKFILHKSQYSDKFTITNDTLDIDKDKIEINPKSIIPIDSSGVPTSIISVNGDDKLILNLSSDFMSLNNALYVNLGPGLTRDDQNRVTINLYGCNLKFINNKLCFDNTSLIDNFNCIKLDDKQRLRLDYSADDFIKDSTGKLYLKIYDKHLKRTQNGVELNIDNDTIKFDTNESKLISSFDKYLVPKYAQNGDIYLENNKMRLNINNYVDDNIGSKIVMNANNKIDLDIVDQTAGEIYFDTNNKLSLRLGHYFQRDSSGHIIPIVNTAHGLNLNNYKLNLDVSPPLNYSNKKVTLDYTPYFKLSSDGKLSLDIDKLITDVIIPKQNEGIKLNNDRTLSIDTSVLTSLINIGSLSALKIVGNTLIVDETEMSKNIIRLNSNSPLKRRSNNYYEVECDRISIDSDFTTGALKVKDTYVPSVVTEDYIKNKVINESYFKDMLKFQGPAILNRCSLCYWDLNNVSDVDKTIGTNSVTINKFHNQKHKFNDFYYFTTEKQPNYNYKHFSFSVFNYINNDNYIFFNNTNQKINFVDSFLKRNQLFSFAFNFIISPEKKTVDINSTLFQSGTDNYIKILYNNQGIIFRFGNMYNARTDYVLESIIPTPTILLNRKNVITIYFNGINDNYGNNKKSIVYVNGNKIQDTILFINPSFISSTQQYNNFQLCNNTDNSQSFNGKFYDFSMLQNISVEEMINLHEYYKYIHNI